MYEAKRCTYCTSWFCITRGYTASICNGIPAQRNGLAAGHSGAQAELVRDREPALQELLEAPVA